MRISDWSSDVCSSDLILVREGETVPVSAELGHWTLTGYADAPATETDAPATEANSPAAAGSTAPPLTKAKVLSENLPPPGVEGFIRATPLTRRIAREQGISLTCIQGTGQIGRAHV